MTDDSDHKNGAPALQPPALTAMQQQQAATDMMLNNFAWPAICSTFNGIILAMGQHGFPPHVVIERICALMGRMAGVSTSVGDLAPILKLRGDCIKAFTAEIRSVNVKAAGPMPQSMDGHKLDS